MKTETDPCRSLCLSHDPLPAPVRRSWLALLGRAITTALKVCLVFVTSWCAVMGAGLTLSASGWAVEWCVVPMCVVGLVAAMGVSALCWSGNEEE